MTLSGLLLFAGVYLAAVSIPGPGFALIIARSLGRGLDGLPAFLAGFAVGDLALMTLAVSGLAFVAHTFGAAFQAVRYGGAIYLCWMAWKIWRAPVVRVDIAATGVRETPARAFLSSLSLTLGNPKPIVFFLSIMPLVVDLRSVTWTSYFEIAAAMVCVLTPVLVGVAVLADRARRVFRSEAALRRINRGTAAVMAGAAVAIAAR
jgi:threonine/homoserine/homoserine lactone efflux protein